MKDPLFGPQNTQIGSDRALEDAEASSPSSARFADLLRDALLHLYDAGHMFAHPLARLVELPVGSGATTRGRILLQALLDAVESLRPPAGTPAESHAWRIYRLLELRYIGGSHASVVISELGISKSQYQRDHARALESLTAVLAGRWQLEQRFAREPNSRESLALDEADNLIAQMDPEYVDLSETLRDLLVLLHPVSQEKGVDLSLEAPSDLPPIRADRVSLRQAFLGLLNAVLDHSAKGSIGVFVSRSGHEIEVLISARRNRTQGLPIEQMDVASHKLDVAYRLFEALNSSVSIEAAGCTDMWGVRVTLPVAVRPVVLVLDNHPDFIELIARYLAGSEWQVVGAQEVRQAKALALELCPSVILLDVMMPKQDGWDLLVLLRERPETRRIPVIVCSVLHEPHMARALGAVDYLTKPITQGALLEALAPWRGKASESGRSG
jgi:CheY-like chemotaxis protein